MPRLVAAAFESVSHAWKSGRRTVETHNRVALVTGANRGIGKEIARGLLRRGMTVLLGARDPARGRAAAAELAIDGEAIFLPLDVTDEWSIGVAAAAIEDHHGRLDVLVNNAGVAATRDLPSEVTAEAMRLVYETNVFGIVAVIHAMLPLLKRSAAGRIVNVSSLRGSLGDPGAFAGGPSIAYSTSKTALNALTVHYARELAPLGIKVNAAAPGHRATDFNGRSGTRTPAEGATIAIRLATLEQDGPTGGFFDENGPIAW
jgi:NAD(P)-dependent dehydrogenase (short-subunit alcohol dehydrogenase family)